MADSDSELEKAEKEEVSAMDRLIQEMIRKRVHGNRKIKVNSTDVHFEVKHLLTTLSDDEKNEYRDIFRNHIRNMILDPEGDHGLVLTIDEDHVLMRQAEEAVQTLDAYRAAAAQQQIEAEQQNAEPQHSPEEKGDSPYQAQNSPEEKGDLPYEDPDSPEAKGDSKGKRPLSPEVKGDSPKDKRKGKRPPSDDAGGPSSKRAARD